MAAKCKICASETRFFSSARILNRYNIAYQICDYCGFIQTEPPYWLNESYSEAINRTDLGLVGRNLRMSKFTKVVIAIMFEPSAKFIDYGGGYGLFVRLMRDYGFDFFRHDKYCQNIFAKGFDVDVAGCKQYELLTAFEVFEHLVDPVKDLQEMLSFAENVLFTTELLPARLPMPTEWWYFGLDHGQHISFFSKRALEILAERFNLYLCSDGGSCHMLTTEKKSSFLFKALNNPQIMTIVSRIKKRKTLLDSDFTAIKGCL